MRRTDMTTLEIPNWTVEIDGETYEVEVATVEEFHLGYEDHGIFTALIRFAGRSWGQALSPMSLDEYDGVEQRRYGTAFGMDYIIECTKQIGSPEQARGRRVVVLRKSSFDLIEGFAALNDNGSIDEPFIPRNLAKKHQETPT